MCLTRIFFRYFARTEENYRNNFIQTFPLLLVNPFSNYLMKRTQVIRMLGILYQMK